MQAWHLMLCSALCGLCMTPGVLCGLLCPPKGDDEDTSKKAKAAKRRRLHQLSDENGLLDD